VDIAEIREVDADLVSELLRGAILVTYRETAREVTRIMRQTAGAQLSALGMGVTAGELRILHFVTYADYGWPAALGPSDKDKIKSFAIAVGVLGAGGRDLLRALIDSNAICRSPLCQEAAPDSMPDMLTRKTILGFIIEEQFCPPQVRESASRQPNKFRLIGLNAPSVPMLMTERSRGPYGPRGYLPILVDPGQCFKPSQTRPSVNTVSEPALQTAVVGKLGDPETEKLLAEAIARASITLLKKTRLAEYRPAVRLVFETTDKEFQFHPGSRQVFEAEFRK
jgi:hypothetical protein